MQVQRGVWGEAFSQFVDDPNKAATPGPDKTGALAYVDLLRQVETVAQQDQPDCLAIEAELEALSRYPTSQRHP